MTTEETPKLDPRFDIVTRNKVLAMHSTLTFFLSAAYSKLEYGVIKVEHSLGDGIYCIDSEGYEITEEMCKALTEKMSEMINSDIPIETPNIGRAELLKFFDEEAQRLDKVGVLKAWQDHFIPCVQYDDFIDYMIEDMCTDKSQLKIFEIRTYDEGLILRYPTFMEPTKLQPWKDRPVLHAIFKEAEDWAAILRADNITDINKAITTKRIEQLIRINEGLHEKKIAKIAQQLCSNFDKKRVITIAGGSSSNKTTFAKRLCVQLRVSGYGATVIEMDDYFQDTEKIPCDKDGKRDLEHISAMNVELLAQRVHTLINGGKIPQRKFNFKRSVGEDSDTKFFTLPEHNFLILEGIHGLNPELLKHLPSCTPIYVCCLTPMKVDLNHRIPTSDLRLMRRSIRDHSYRGVSVRKSIQMWTSVRVGEEKNIFPYHENAEHFFNSALIYELNVYSITGRVILSEGTFPEKGEDTSTPESKIITREAQRLLGLLKLFYPLNPDHISKVSTIREFIGGSGFDY
jgi:uridine kinase